MIQRYAGPNPVPGRLTMAAIGDSLAYGMGASRREHGLAHRLFTAMRDERPESTLYNYAVPHATMGDVLRNQVPHLNAVQIDIVLLIAGANDLRYTRDALVFARRFRHLLQAVHRAVPDSLVVAAGMPDVTQTVGVPAIVKPAVSHLCARLNARMRAICGELGDGFIDLFTYTNQPLCPGAEYLCEDGFHPNDFGYEEIAARAYPAIAAAIAH